MRTRSGLLRDGWLEFLRDVSWIEAYWWPMPKKQSPWRPSFFTLSILPGSAGASRTGWWDGQKADLDTSGEDNLQYQTHANRQRSFPHSTCQWLFVEQELLESIPFSSPGFLLLYFYGIPNFVGEHLDFLMCYVPGSQDLLQNCTTAKRFQSDFGNIWSSPNLPIARNNLDRQWVKELQLPSVA